jgi:CARDB protein
MVAGRPTALLAVAACIGGSAAFAASEGPNLVVTRLAVSQHGVTLRITETVRNVGATTSPRSTIGYYLGRARIGGHPLARLQARTSTSSSIGVRIPRQIAAGSYRIRACTNDHHQLRLSNCRAAGTTVEVPDQTPPVFAGLKQALTCIAGPISPGRSSTYRLNWAPASDNSTPPSQIVYDIYQANSPGGENFATPTYSATAGATTFTTPLLTAADDYYFVVRARDQSGNRDSNRVERQAVNQCL